MNNSIKVRLILGLSILQIITWIAIGWFGGGSVWRELREGYFVGLTQFGLAVEAIATMRDKAANSSEYSDADVLYSEDLPIGVTLEDLGDHLLQAWKDGHLIIRSESAPSIPLDVQIGLSQMEIENEKWEVYHRISPISGIHTLVAIRSQEVNGTIFHTLIGIVLPVALIGIVGSVVAFVFLMSAFKPLEQWSGKIGAWSPNANIEMESVGVVSEVLPVQQAITRMLARVQRSLELERQFVRDASHELRTPLTAIQTQLDAEDWSELSASQSDRLKKVKLGVKRTTRLVHQLLDLARAQDHNTGGASEVIDVIEVTTLALEEIVNTSPNLLGRLEFDSPPGPIWMECNPRDIEVVLSNLVDNAAKYSGDEATIMVSISVCNGVVSLVVDDDGPGIPTNKVSDAFERFVRLTPTQSYGSGLGLSLIKEIAEKYGGEVSLCRSSRLMGLCARFSLPEKQSK